MQLQDKEIEEIIENNGNFSKENSPNFSDRENKEDNDEKVYINRNEVSKDRDRILYSKAFRRLEHKAQVYSHTMGDHFRTRLTHSLEVMQISRSIAKNLGLNEELAEAIAIGHDVGHTPFGHIGEETLDGIMRGEDNLGNKIRPDFHKGLDFGGFKHNYFSIKILDLIEKKFHDKKGLNLTWQVLEGILLHTKIEKLGKKWDLNRFTENTTFKKFFFDLKNGNILEDIYNHSISLEGQIVNIADEIAQRQHDLDDGLRDIELNLSIKKIIDKFSEKSFNSEKNNYENVLLKALINKLKPLLNNSYTKTYKVNTLTREIINYFIEDVTYASLKNLKNLENYIKFYDGKCVVTKKLINFSDSGEKVNNYFETYINRKIINSYNVNRFDGKSKFIVRQLFKAYYTNPRQMPKKYLERLMELIKDNNYFYELKFKENNKKIININFAVEDREVVDDLIKLLKIENLNEIIDKLNAPENVEKHSKVNFLHNIVVNYIKNFLPEHIINEIPEKDELLKTLEMEDYGSSFIKDNLKEINDTSFGEFLNEKNLSNSYNSVSNILYSKLNNSLEEKNISNMNEEEKFYKVILENHYAYLNIICEYIAQMTDNFANEEYKNLYLS